MSRGSNYSIQAAQARARFLTYDQEALIRKLDLRQDPDYLYASLFSRSYRIHRRTGDIEKLAQGQWQDANTFAESLTLLDLVCDSRPDRHPAGRWKAMSAFGLMFHQNLLEGQRDPWADRFEADPDSFRRSCEALGGRALNIGDMAFVIPVFDTLELCLQLWFGDEEFPAGLRLLWDENALQYLKYETMYFAKGLLFQFLSEALD